MTAATTPQQTLAAVTAGVEERGAGIAVEVVGRKVGGSPQPSGQASPWHQLQNYGLTITPPYPPEQLVTLPHVSSILPQCLRALVQGIHGHGYGFDPVFDPSESDADEAFLAEAESERDRAEQFFDSASLDYSFAELTARTQLDLCTIGWSGWEFIRDSLTGELCGLEHVSAVNLRLGIPDSTPTLITRWVMKRDGSGWRKVPAWKYLRRFVQITNGRMVFFKEIGDPRAIDRHTGRVVRAAATREDLRDPNMARELLWFAHYDPASPDGYGVPPWIGTLVDIAGERAASVVNWSYFDNKSVPPLAILVQGGALTKESYERIAEKLNELKGTDNYHKALILEATTAASGSVKDLLDVGGSVTPKVEIKNLTEAQHGDALFQNYTTQSREKVRSACGVPPILIGESSDYTRATAQVAMEVAEAFMFRPQRNQFDDRVQRFVMSELQVAWWTFRSNPPNLADTEEISQAIEAGVKAGVGSPNIYAQVLEKVLGVEIPQQEQQWANFPIDLTKAAMASGMVSLDFSDGSVGVEVNEDNRDRFKAMVAEIIDSGLERALMRARTAALKKGSD